jgi:hypothetical protein
MTGTDNVMKYIVGLAAAAAVSLSGWNMLSTVGHESRIGIVEERTANQRDTLGRIESKLDRLIEHQYESAPASAYPRRGAENAQPVPSGRRTETP